MLEKVSSPLLFEWENKEEKNINVEHEIRFDEKQFYESIPFTQWVSMA